MKKKNLSTIALLLVVSLLFVACGEKQSSEAKQDPGQTTSSEITWGNLRPEGLSEDFPKKNITYIYPFGPGGAMDAYVRLIFDKIAEKENWKNKLIIDYREGGSGRVGWNALAEAKTDGYTIGFTPTAMLVGSNSEDVSFGHDANAYIYNLMSDPGAIGVAADSKYNTLKELVEDAKKNPGTIGIGVTSVIGQEGLTVKLLQKNADTEFNMVAFNTESDVLAGVSGGHIDAFCLNVSDCLSFIENGSIKILATGDNTKAEFSPDAPTYKESGYDVYQVNMRAISGPADMDENTRLYLERCIEQAIKEEDIVKKVEEMKVPIKHLNGADTKAAFSKVDETLKELWQSDPWQ